MLNVYKIPTEKHLVADSSAADGISVLETLASKFLEYVSQVLRHHKKLNGVNIIRSTISSLLSTH